MRIPWKVLLQVYTSAVVTQVWIEKMFNTNTESVQFDISVKEH